MCRIVRTIIGRFDLPDRECLVTECMDELIQNGIVLLSFSKATKLIVESCAGCSG
jgi:hypothetical protein